MAERKETRLHGHCLSYLALGSGPVLVLLHGLADSATTWEPVLPELTRRYSVIAPDLPGHGASDRLMGDCSAAAYATVVRDLLGVLGHDRATIVGHSLGGGVALQFAYLFPERTERLVLVASGGLGRELHPLLRIVSLPGAELVLPWLCASTTRRAVVLGTRLAGQLGLLADADVEELWRVHASLGEAEARQAFLRTLRALVDVAGQRADASDRLYLAAELPTFLVWGDRDTVIPVSHAYAAHRLIDGSRLAVLESTGHFPHRCRPERFVELLVDFLSSTRPARMNAARWRALVAGGEAASGRSQAVRTLRL